MTNFALSRRTLFVTYATFHMCADINNMLCQQRGHGDAVGSPYLAAHVRRQDFAKAHARDVPSLAYTASQITEKLVAHNLQTVFIATDAPDEGFAMTVRQ